MALRPSRPVGRTLCKLEPQDASTLLTTALWLHLSNAGLFGAVVAVVAIPQTVLFFALQAGREFFLAQVVLAVGVFVIAGAVARVVSQRFLGMAADPAGVYREIGRERFAVLVLSMVAVSACVLAGFVVVVPGIYVLIRFLFVPQVAAIEGGSIGDALTRSWRLSAGAWWRTFGVFFVSYLPIVVVTGAARSYLHANVALLVQDLIVPVILWPFSFAALTLLYYDQRVRRDGDEIVREVDRTSPWKGALSILTTAGAIALTSIAILVRFGPGH